MKLLLVQWFLVGLVILIASLPAVAFQGQSRGILLEQTRVIYSGSSKNGITFQVTNTTDQVYLLQSRVLPWDLSVVEKDKAITSSGIITGELGMHSKGNSPPFIVLPPLVRFAPDDVINLKIKLTKNDLPKDRESLFMLSLKAIPSQDAPGSNSVQAKSRVVLALQNNLKFFYRPQGIPSMDYKQRADKLKFIQKEGKVTIENPTPYYITLDKVMINNRPLVLGSQRMIAPFSTTEYHSTVPHGQTIEGQLIDDAGQTRYFKSTAIK